MFISVIHVDNKYGMPITTNDNMEVQLTLKWQKI